MLKSVRNNGNTSVRTLLPIFAEEELVEENNLDDESCRKNGEQSTQVERYKLGKLGLLRSDLRPNSHRGIVTFSLHKVLMGVSENRGTEVQWDVAFDVHSRKAFWQSVTEKTISNACDNLACYAAVPNLFKCKKIIQVPKHMSPKSLADKWFLFVWRKGGGLPVIPPVSISKNGLNRMYIPPFLEERILSIKETKEGAEIVYTVPNPKLIQAHTHLGRVSFIPVDGSLNKIEMNWEVSVRPFRNRVDFVRLIVEPVISTLARNFKVYIEEPEAMIKLFSMFQIRKHTWLGNVVDAHNKDNRSMKEQFRDFWRPFSWGNKEDGDYEIVVQLSIGF